MSLDNILELDPVDNPESAGLRPLTEEEFLQRAESMACIDPAKPPGMSVCSQVLWISLFFDGAEDEGSIRTFSQKSSLI